MSEISFEIETRLQTELRPIFLEIENESNLHAGHHHGGTHSHYAITVVSPAFEKISLVKRHRIVYDLLRFLFEQGLHALKIKAYTPEEWRKNAG